MRWLFPEDPDRRTRRDRVLLLLFAVLLVFLVARAARKPGGVLVHNQAFGARYLAGLDPYVEKGERVYGVYPPGFVWIAAPLALLPTKPARIVWASVQAAALVAIAATSRRWLRRARPELAPHFSVLFAIALLLASRYLLRDFAGGGANTVHAALLATALDQAGRGRAARSGLAFAFSLVTKPYLAPCLALFAARGQWRVLGATAVAGVVLFLLPGIPFGIGRWLEIGARWSHEVAAFARAGDPSRAEAVPAGYPLEDTSMNQSLGAALRRASEAAGGGAELTGAASSTARLIAVVLLLVCVSVAWRTRARTCARTATSALGRRGLASTRGEVVAAPSSGSPDTASAPEAGPLSDAAAALAFLPLCLLASPVTWKAHHVLLLPLFFLLVVAAAGAQRKRLAFAALGIYWVLCGLMNEELLGRAGKLVFERLSVVTWGDLALLAAAIAIAMQGRKQTGHAEEALRGASIAR